MISAIILGAGAGGGFPQWNSNAPACRRARAGDAAARPCTQASVAVSFDGANWFVLNASPDIKAQIEATPALHPRHGLRSTPIAGVVLASAEIDAIAGLLTLREAQPFGIFATAPVLAKLDENPIFEVLVRGIVQRTALELGARVALPVPDGGASGLTVTAFEVPGKVPLYTERARPQAENVAGETVGLEIGDGARRLVFLPGCAAVDDALRARLQGADALLFDGTLWSDDEMVRAGLGRRTGRDMGHLSLSGAGGTLAALANVRAGRRILIHINNSNPILLAESAERRGVESAGWTVGFDGMEINL